MKRDYEDVFSQGANGDLLTQISFKQMAVSERDNSCRGEFIPSNILEDSNMRQLSLENYLHMEDIEVLKMARKINSQREDADEASDREILSREIKKVRRRPHAGMQQNHPEQITEEKVEAIKIELPQATLEDPNLENMKIEYLEEMTKDTGLQVTKEQAKRMKCYTDLLLNAVVTKSQNKTERMKKESQLLKRAFRIQSALIDSAKKRIAKAEEETRNSYQKIELLQQENSMMENLLLQMSSK